MWIESGQEMECGREPARIMSCCPDHTAHSKKNSFYTTITLHFSFLLFACLWFVLRNVVSPNSERSQCGRDTALSIPPHYSLGKFPQRIWKILTAALLWLHPHLTLRDQGSQYQSTSSFSEVPAGQMELQLQNLPYEFKKRLRPLKTVRKGCG